MVEITAVTKAFAPSVIDAAAEAGCSAIGENYAQDLLSKRSTIERLGAYRAAVADRLRFRIGNIASGDVGAPAQLDVIARTLLVAVVNHEYQHSQWIGEVRQRDLGHSTPAHPTSALLTEIDGYCVLAG